MRQGIALLLGLLAACLAGCTTGEVAHSTSWLARLRPFGAPTGADVVQIDVALLERPLGDRYINRDLWTLVDEQDIPLERKAVLEEAGFRVGQIGGLPPAELQALLTATRSCPDPRRLYLHAQSSTLLPLGPAMATCRYRIVEQGASTLVTLQHAECGLSVVPALEEGGNVRLKCTPQVRHGEIKLMPHASADDSGWNLLPEKPTRTYSQLGWEVSLSPNQYLVVGGREDRPESFGYRCFARVDEPQSVQRLLVIRATRLPAAGTRETQTPAAGSASSSGGAPLALQAAGTSARGSQQ